MSLNPLAPVTNYESKLSRIFWFTSIATVAAIWLLRDNVPALDLALQKIDFKLGAGENLPLPGGYLLPALVVGLVSRVFRLHDRISDLLGIRERFDIDVIIAELAAQSGFDLAEITDPQLIRQRSQIMGKAFYRFTSSKNPQVDEHLIHQALDWWSWLWVVLEAVLVFVLTGLALIAFRVPSLGIAVMFGSLAVAGLSLPIIWSQCRRYAVAQVAAIMSDPALATQVVDVLHDTLSPARTELAGWHVNGAGSAKHSAAMEDRWSRHLRR